MNVQKVVVYDQMAEQKGSLFGAKLRELRNRRGLSQFQVAIRLGKTPSKVAQYESGARNPTKASIHELAEVLCSTPAERDELFIAAGFVPEGGMPESPTWPEATEAFLRSTRMSDAARQQVREFVREIWQKYGGKDETGPEH